MDKKTRKIDYVCKFCKFEWNLEYQLAVIPPVQIKCPSCNKIANHQKPYNFFKDETSNVQM